jgi:hypothetical protein
VLVAVGAAGTAAGGEEGGGGGGEEGGGGEPEPPDPPPASSYAPMSQLPPPGCGRGTPRWSVVTASLPMSVHEPASTAGLSAGSAWVGVCPPLSWSGPSFGSVLVRSPVAPRPQVSAPRG